MCLKRYEAEHTAGTVSCKELRKTTFRC